MTLSKKNRALKNLEKATQRNYLVAKIVVWVLLVGFAQVAMPFAQAVSPALSNVNIKGTALSSFGTPASTYDEPIVPTIIYIPFGLTTGSLGNASSSFVSQNPLAIISVSKFDSGTTDFSNFDYANPNFYRIDPTSPNPPVDYSSPINDGDVLLIECQGGGSVLFYKVIIRVTHFSGSVPDFPTVSSIVFGDPDNQDSEHFIFDNSVGIGSGLGIEYSISKDPITHKDIWVNPYGLNGKPIMTCGLGENATSPTTFDCVFDGKSMPSGMSPTKLRYNNGLATGDTDTSGTPYSAGTVASEESDFTTTEPGTSIQFSFKNPGDLDITNEQALPGNNSVTLFFPTPLIAQSNHFKNVYYMYSLDNGPWNTTDTHPVRTLANEKWPITEGMNNDGVGHVIRLAYYVPGVTYLHGVVSDYVDPVWNFASLDLNQQPPFRNISGQNSVKGLRPGPVLITAPSGTFLSGDPNAFANLIFPAGVAGPVTSWVLTVQNLGSDSYITSLTNNFGPGLTVDNGDISTSGTCMYKLNSYVVASNNNQAIPADSLLTSGSTCTIKVDWNTDTSTGGTLNILGTNSVNIQYLGAYTGGVGSVNLNISSSPQPPAITLSSTAETIILGNPIQGYTIDSSGGGQVNPPYTISPSPLNGISFDSTTGTLSGTPISAAAPIDYTITASNFDSNGSPQTGTAIYTLTVLNVPPVITSSAAGQLVSSTVGSPISEVVTFSTINPPGILSLTSGFLPPGVMFDTSTGIVSGTPTAPGIFSPTVAVTDSLGDSATTTLNFLVTSPGKENPNNQSWVDHYFPPGDLAGTPPDWTSIGSSSDGSHLVAVAKNSGQADSLWTSNDFGSTWVNRTVYTNAGGGAAEIGWNAVASSGDGSRLVAAEFQGNIWTSSDYGLNWSIQANSPKGNWIGITSSTDGSHIAGAIRGQGGDIWTSSDYGATWVDRTLSNPQQWTALASNSEGSHLIAGTYSGGNTGGALWTSSDYGATWDSHTVSAGPQNWTALASNGDGTKLIATTDVMFGPGIGNNYPEGDSGIWTSWDSGSTWESQTVGSTLGQWTSLASSSDGVRIAGLSGGYVFTSTDSGVTWRAESSANVRLPPSNLGSLTALTSSADGKLIAAVGEDIDLWSGPASDLDPESAPDFAVSSVKFGPTNMGQSESSTITIFTPPNWYPNPSYHNWHIASTGSDFSILDASKCENVETGDGDLGGSTPFSCPITINFSPSKIGSVGGILSMDFWTANPNNPNEFFTETIALDGLGIQALPSQNPPFVWETHTVTPSLNFPTVVASNDGSHLAVNSGPKNNSNSYDIFTSQDYGITWQDTSFATTNCSTNLGDKVCSLLTSSSDGMHLVTAAYSGDIYTSSNGGSSWRHVIPPTTWNCKCWTSLAASENGKYLALADGGDSDGGDIYTSSDYGSTWTDSTLRTQSPGVELNWTSVAVSSDGSKIVAGTNGGTIYTSGNGGLNWTKSNYQGDSKPVAISVSGDGSRVNVAVFNGDIFASSDFGNTWSDLTPQLGNQQWNSITTSRDGTRISATAHGDYIYSTNNYGVTWESQTVAGVNPWTSVASSADGQSLIAAGEGTDIWTLRSAYVPPAPVAAAVIPSPAQMSRIDSLSPIFGEAEKVAPVVLTGKFIETILRIAVNGIELPSGSWKQTSTAISFLMPTAKVGTYSIELFNGSVPLLPTQSFVVKATQASAGPATTPQINKPSVNPTQDQPRIKPLLQTLTTNIYFDLASYVINSKNFTKLAALAKRISGLGSNITIAITGYAQPTPGSEATDGLLSKRRAAEVAKIMRSVGVNTRIIYKGAGRAAVNDPSSRYVQIVAANS